MKVLPVVKIVAESHRCLQDQSPPNTGFCGLGWIYKNRRRGFY
jgi:hypothetical protein